MSRRSALIMAGIYFALGALLLLQAHSPHAHPILIREGGRFSRIDPWLGYFGAIVSFAGTAYGLFLAFRRNGSGRLDP
jgi:hypothetical protein